MAVDIRPTVDDLGALMRARTKVRGGVELGTFRDSPDPATRPTATELNGVINRVLPTVSVMLGAFTSDLADVAKTAVSYKVAQVVELDYWPEQNDTDQSAAAQWAALFTELLAAIQKAVEGDAPGTTTTGFGSIVTLGISGRRTIVSLTGDTATGSPVVSNVSTSRVVVGAQVIGAGVPLGTTVLTVDSPSQLTLSADATADAASVALTLVG